MRYVLLVLMTALWAFSASAQEPPDKALLRSLEGKSLTAAIKKLSKKNGVPFSYSSGSIDNLKVPALSDSVSTVGGLLSETLGGSAWNFERIGGTYVIFFERGESPVKPLRSNFSLSGVVRDKQTGEALPFATVAVMGSPGASTTNTDGKFTLLKVPSDTATVTARYLGYEPVLLSLTPGLAAGLLSLELERTERNLPSVEIAARKEQMIQIGSRVGQLAFNPVEISRLPNLGENDLFAALRFLPGISANREAGSGLRIRGSSSDENMVLFDGIPVYHVDHFFGFLSAFNSNVVKNVQVSKGGFGARYGARAAGLINITGIDGNKKEPSLTLEASALSMSALVELPIVEDKASLVFAYRRAYTDIIGSPTYRGMFNNLFNSSIPNVQPTDIDVFGSSDPPDYSFYDLNAKFHFKPSEKDAISMSFYQGRDDLGIAFGGAADGIRRISRDDVSWGNQGGSFKWSRKWGKRFFTYANFGVSRYRSNLDAEVSFFRGDDVLLSRRFFDQRINLDDNTLRIDNAYEVSPNSRIEFGFWNTDYRITLQSQDMDFIFSDSLQQARLTAGYVDYEQRLGRWTAKGGIRVSYYDGEHNVYFEPRLSLSFDAGEFTTLKASAGRYTQVIRRLNERSLYFSIAETWALAGQADVPVLNSDQFIAGVVFDRYGWELDVEAYHKRENGVVEFLFPEFGLAGGNLDQLAIGGERRITGADFLLRKSFGKHQFLVSYTIMSARSRYAGVNRGESFRSAGVSTHEAGLVYNIRLKRWDFSAAVVAASGQPFTPALGTFTVTLENGDQQQFVGLGRVNSELTDWIHRADISAGYTLPLKKGALKFGVSVYNIYNNMNVKFIDYFEIPEEDSEFYTLGRRDVFGLGITPSFFMRLKL